MLKIKKKIKFKNRTQVTLENNIISKFVLYMYTIISII